MILTASPPDPVVCACDPWTLCLLHYGQASQRDRADASHRRAAKHGGAMRATIRRVDARGERAKIVGV